MAGSTPPFFSFFITLMLKKDEHGCAVSKKVLDARHASVEIDLKNRQWCRCVALIDAGKHVFLFLDSLIQRAARSCSNFNFNFNSSERKTTRDEERIEHRIAASKHEKMHSTRRPIF